MQCTTQAVFLVDINAVCKRKTVNDSEFEKSLAALRLCTLKLLTYFLHRQIRGDERVKWGHKFYNSLIARSVPQKCALQEMKIDSFEDFENDLIVRLTKEREHQQKLVDLTNEYTLPKIDGETSASANYENSHSASLRNSLKEVLCDFQWDRPDITSPIRKSKKHRTKFKNNVNDGGRENMVFIMSECPWTTEDLSMFLCHKSGHLKLNTNSIFSSLMTSNMENAYCGPLKLRVFWVDTTGLSSQWSSAQETGGYDLVEETLSRLNGTIIPISSLVQMSSSHAFPVTSVISWYLGTSPKPSSLKAQLMQKGEMKNAICQFEIAPVDKVSPPLSKPTCKHPYFTTVTAEGLVPMSFLPTELQFTSLLALPTKTNRAEFLGLLHHLLLCKMSLIVDCAGDTGILSPLTSTVATLELITCCPQGLAILTTDCSQCKVLNQDQSIFSKEKSSLQQFIDSSITHIIKSQPVQSSEISYDNSTSADCAIPVKCQFSGHLLDKWFCTTGAHTSSPDSIKKSSDERKAREACITYKVRRVCCPKRSTCIKTNNAPADDTSVKTKQTMKMNVSARASQLVSFSQERQLRRQQRQRARELKNLNNSSSCPATESKPKECEPHWMNFCRDLEVANDSDLSTRLKIVYQDSIDGSLPVSSSAGNIVNVVIYYVRCTSNPSSEKHCKELLESELYKTPSTVNETYETLDQPSTKNQRIREYELQALLRLETLAALPNECNQEKLIEEVAAHLRNLSFVASPVHLGEFLRDTVYCNYISNLPDAVKAIFDELNQPLPQADDSDSSEGSRNANNNVPFPFSELDGFLSDTNTVDTSSVSSPPGHHKRKSLQRYHSFSEASQKRQIVVPANKKGREKTRKSRKSRTRRSPRSSSTRMIEQTNDVEKVCRNLFKRGLQSPLKGILSKTNEEEPKKKIVLKTREAPNTPFHKQVANPHLQKQARLRKNTKSLSSIECAVVAESPIKAAGMACDVPNNTLNNSLPFYPPASQKSCNVHKLKFNVRSKSENIPAGTHTQFTSPPKAGRVTRSQSKSPKVIAAKDSMVIDDCSSCSQKITAQQSVTPSKPDREVSFIKDASISDLPTKNEDAKFGSSTDYSSILHCAQTSQEDTSSIHSSYNPTLTRLTPSKQSPKLLHEVSPLNRVTRSQINHIVKAQLKECSVLLSKRCLWKPCKKSNLLDTSSNFEINESCNEPNDLSSQESSGEQRVPSEVDHSVSPELFCNLSPQPTRVTRNQFKKEVSPSTASVTTSHISRRPRKKLLFSMNNDGSSKTISGEQVVPLAAPVKMTRSRSRSSVEQASCSLGGNFVPTSRQRYTVNLLSSFSNDSVTHQFSGDCSTLNSTSSSSEFRSHTLGSNFKQLFPVSSLGVTAVNYNASSETNSIDSNSNENNGPKTRSFPNELIVGCSTGQLSTPFKAVRGFSCVTPDDKLRDCGSKISSSIICDADAVSKHDNYDCSDDTSIVKSSPVLQGTVSPEPLTLGNLQALNDLCSYSFIDKCRRSSRESSKSFSSSFQSDEISIQFTEQSEQSPHMNSSKTPENSQAISTEAQQPSVDWDNQTFSSGTTFDASTDEQQSNEKLLVNQKQVHSAHQTVSTLNKHHSRIFSRFPLVQLERCNFEIHCKNGKQIHQVASASLSHWRKIKPRYGTPRKFVGTRSSNRIKATNEADFSTTRNSISNLITISPSRSASATPSKSYTPRTLSRKRRFSTGEVAEKPEILMYDFEQIPIQRLTRNQSKEIGISADELKIMCTKTPEKLDYQSQLPTKRPCLALQCPGFSSDSEDEVFFSGKTFLKSEPTNPTKLRHNLRTRQNILSSKIGK